MYFRKHRTRILGQTALFTSALFLAHIGNAGAVDIPVPAGTTENDTQILEDDGDTLTVEDGGTIATVAGANGAEAPEDDQTVDNAGTIDAGATGVFSTGARVTITNRATGQILADQTAIEAEGDDATIINDGVIEAVNTGVYSTGDRAIITTTGTILADEIAIESYGDDANIRNDGMIEAIIDGVVSTGERATITNSATGIITAADDDGIVSEGDDSTIINDGQIFADDDGIKTIADSATIINNGIINAGDDGIDSDDGDTANGDGQFTRTINNGVINSGDEAIDSDAENHIIINNGALNADTNGIEATRRNALITNNGTINADTFNGIVVRESDAYVLNTGTINAGDDGIDVDEDAFEAVVINRGTVIGAYHAILVDGDDATVMLEAGSVLDGAVAFNGLGLILNIGTGLNLYLDYGGEIDTLNSDIPIVHDETNTIIYTVDPTGFALSQSFIQTTSDAVHDAVRSGTGFGNGFGGGFSGTESFAYGANDPGFGETGPRGWVSAFGGYNSQDGSGAVTGGDQAYGGLVTGGGFASDERMYGAFLGGSYSQLETDFDTQQIDAASFYGGLYAGTRSGPFWIDGALLIGYSDFDSDRIVANNLVPGGLETATADYDGYFISPSITVGRSIGERTEFSIGGHYAGLFLDGYTETGSAANLTVAGRDVHVAAIRAKATYLAHQKQIDSGLVSVETWAGVDGVFNFGDDVAASVVAGPFDAFEATFTDTAAIGFAGIGVNHKPANGNWSFNASLEGRYGTDDFSEIRATATAGMRF